MNLIRNIEIRNFKSIRHQKIDDCRRINVFVGYPNTGKSNLLEAIGLYSSFRLKGESFRFNDLCRLKRFSELFFNKDYRNAVNVILNDKLLLELILEQSNNLDIRIHRLKYTDTGRDVQIYSSSIPADSKYEYRDRNSINEPAFQEVMGPIRKYEFKADIPLDKKSPLVLGVPYGDNLLEVLHSNSALRKEIASLFEDYNQKLVIDDEEIIFLKYLNDDTGVSIPYHLVADTLRRLIFYKSAIFSNTKSILLFEEPEAHMFPPYISKFTADMMYDKNGNQFFINTHSPFVINDLMENLSGDDLSIYVVGYKKDIGETFLRRLTDNELHEIYQYGIDLYLNLENYLFHEQQ